MGMLEFFSHKVPAPQTPVRHGALREAPTAILPPIVMLGSGRCGSTLVQRMINTSPAATLWGEHAGFLKGLAQSYFELTQGDEMRANYYGNPIDPSLITGSLTQHDISINWVNGFSKSDIRSAWRRMLTSLFTQGIDPTTTRWGFKEIRYIAGDRTVEMWQELFPQTHFIFVTRHPLDVIQSCILAWHSDLLTQGADAQVLLPLIESYALRWKQANDGILAWSALASLKHHTIIYERLTAAPRTEAERLFAFLNLDLPTEALAPMMISLEASRYHPAASAVRHCIQSQARQLNSLLGDTAAALGYPLLSHHEA